MSTALTRDHRFGLYFWSLGDKKATKLQSEMYAKILIENMLLRTSGCERDSRAGGQGEVKGGDKPPFWGNGGKEEMKKGIKI